MAYHPSMKRILCLATLLLSSVLSAWLRRSPHIVIFLVDDMGVMGHLRAVPHRRDGKPQRYPLNDFYRTPNMEAWRRAHPLINQFCAMSVCSPTRSPSLRARTPPAIAPPIGSIPIRTTPAPSARRIGTGGGKAGRRDARRPAPGAGYRTIHIGKGHFSPRAFEGADPANLGFDINVGGASIGAPGSYYGQQNYGHGTPRAQAAVPHLESITARNFPHRGADPRSQGARERCREGGQALLPLLRALRRSRPL